nr:ubiquitin-conjugating enzyme E2 Q2-like [Chlorocebus sabaeus]
MKTTLVHIVYLAYFLKLHQQLKCWICGLCRLDNLPKHLDVEMPDQPLPMGQILKITFSFFGAASIYIIHENLALIPPTFPSPNIIFSHDIEDLDHYEMKEEPISGKMLEDEGTENKNWAILEKIRKTENVLTASQRTMPPLAAFPSGKCCLLEIRSSE